MNDEEFVQANHVDGWDCDGPMDDGGDHDGHQEQGGGDLVNNEDGGDHVGPQDYGGLKDGPQDDGGCDQASNENDRDRDTPQADGGVHEGPGMVVNLTTQAMGMMVVWTECHLRTSLVDNSGEKRSSFTRRWRRKG